MKKICLNTKSLKLEFSEENGALIGMTSVKTGWVIQRRPELGMSWRLLVPVNDELRNNPVYGEKQKLSSYEVKEDRIHLVWENVVSKRAGALPIRVIVDVCAEGNQAVWYTRIENNSDYIVECVHSPYIGDLSRPEDAKWFKSFTYHYADAVEKDLWPVFTPEHTNWSVDYESHLSSATCTPVSPYYLLRDENQGLYVGVKNSSAELVAWHCELRPGYSSAIDSRVPEQDEIAGKPVHTLFAPVHMCYVQPGANEDLTPIALEAYVGDWQKGVDIYKAWTATWLRQADIPAWAAEPHSWLQIHVNSPEDELRLRFTELPKVAEECARYGVKAIQLVGWNDGGQDQGNPSHTPDPRLGTFEELKEAIAKCQELGVKIIIFSKFTWSDRALDWFREELVNYATKNPYGDYYQHGGYKYQTPAQLLGINTKNLIPMCFGSDKYLEICRNEFKKLIELGCDGMLYDECQHHSPALLCFDTSHGHKYGWPVYQNDRKLINYLRQTEGLREDFFMAGEACYDWEFEEYGLAYFRSKSKTHIPLARYMRPTGQYMTAISGFNDRNMINQCLMYRYIISYEPYNFKGWLHDFPETVAYGTKMDALRTKYRKHLWDAEFIGTEKGTVTTEEGLEHPTYSRFKADDGSLALVICNYEDVETSVCVGKTEYTFEKYCLVDEDVWYPLTEKTSIPPRSAIVVL